MTKARLVQAVVSTAAEEAVIALIWLWVLPGFDISLPLAGLIAVMCVWLVFSVCLFLFTTRVIKKQNVVGLPSMVGSRGRVVRALAPEGQVKIRGEIWRAVTEGESLGIGEDVEVVGESGLKLMVRRRDASGLPGGRP